MSIRILHAADLHMDSPFEGLPDDSAAMMRREQRLLPEKIVAEARRRQADMIVLSGDLLDSDCAYMETMESLRAHFGETEMPIFIAPGNHDCLSGASPYERAELPKNVHIFNGELQCVELEELKVRVWGAGFTDRNSPPLLESFRAEKKAGYTDIMVIHGDPVMTESPYNAVSRKQISESGMDYIAFGHIHTFSGLQRSGNTFYAWPGCPSGRGFDETGEKGVILAEVSPGNVKVSFVPIAGRRYETVHADLSNAESEIAAVESALPENLEGGVCRLVLEGETAATPDIGAIRAALEGRFLALQIKDKTRIKRSVWEGAGSDTLRGIFLKRLLDMYESAENERERDRITRAARYGLLALDKGEDIPW